MGVRRSHPLARLLLVAAWLVAPAVVLAGDCRLAQEHYHRATQPDQDRERLLEQAVDLCPDFAAALNNLGFLREEQGRLAEAESLYARAAQADPQMTAPYAGLGDVRRAQGDYDGAVQAYEEFLRRLGRDRQRGDPEGLAQYEEVYRARLAEVVAKGGKQSVVGSGGVVSADEIVRRLDQGSQVVVGKRGIRPEPAKIDIQILFATNSDRISEESRQQIEEVAKALGSRALRRARILIQGHTDSVGSAQYNLELSRRRAASVKRALVDELGVAGYRLSTEGRGETAPIADNDTPQGRAANRRVTFVNQGG
jgi:outer membrane protein OmpA-like peptidoglycan-associated protein